MKNNALTLIFIFFSAVVFGQSPISTGDDSKKFPWKFTALKASESKDHQIIDLKGSVEISLEDKISIKADRAILEKGKQVLNAYGTKTIKFDGIIVLKE